MIYILETFKEKPIRKLLLMIAVFGFLFSFFYQVLVEYNFSKINFRIDFGEGIIVNFVDEKEKLDPEFFLLSGWNRGQKVDKPDAIWSKSVSSSIAILLPQSTYQISLKLFFYEEGSIEVFINKELVTILKPKVTGEWQNFQFLVPSNLISEGFNKIGFINLSKNKTTVGYKVLGITNYRRMPFAFPGGYTLFNKAHWFSHKERLGINWLSCFLGGFILPIFWIFYSIWFSSLSEIEFSKALRLDYFSYLPSIIILLAIYLFSRAFLYDPLLTKRGFLLFGIGLVSCGKVYQLCKYTTRAKTKAQINFLKDIITSQIFGSAVIIGFIIFLVICTILLIFKQVKIAGQIANRAYLLLVIGVMLRLIQLLSEQRR